METKLKELGIYELREYARKVGVKSPTTKVRAELEREILLAEGKNQKDVDFGKRGRPPKRVLLNVNEKGELKPLPNFYDKQKILAKTKELINFEIFKFTKRVMEILENSIMQFQSEEDKKQYEFIKAFSLLNDLKKK